MGVTNVSTLRAYLNQRREVPFCIKIKSTGLTGFDFPLESNHNPSLIPLNGTLPFKTRPLIGSHGWLSLSRLVQRRAGCRVVRCGRCWVPSATRPTSSSCVAKLTPRRSWTFPCSSALSVGPPPSIRAQYLSSVIPPPPPPMASVSDPDSLIPILIPKHRRKIYSWKINLILFCSKRQFLLIPRLPWKTSKLQEKPLCLKTQKRTSSTLTWIFLTFFYFLGHFCLPGSGPGFKILIQCPDWIRIQSGSGSETLPIALCHPSLCHPALAFFPQLKRMEDRFTTCRIWFFPITDGHRVNCASTFTHAETTCWFERGEGGGLGAKSYYRKKARSAIIIQYSLKLPIMVLCCRSVYISVAVAIFPHSPLRRIRNIPVARYKGGALFLGTGDALLPLYFIGGALLPGTL